MSPPAVEVVRQAGPTSIVAARLWAVGVRLLVALVPLRMAVAMLDRFPPRAPRRRRPIVELPDDHRFREAGAPVARQLARSQFLRRRGVASTIVIGPAPPGGGPLDGPAWLERIDAPAGPVARRLHRWA